MFVSQRVVAISTEELRNGCEEKLQEGARAGFFLIEIPEECRPLLIQAMAYANEFYRDEALKAERLSDEDRKQEPFSGYYKREGLQVESAYFQKGGYFWSKFLPEEVQAFASRMSEFALEVMRQTLVACGINLKRCPETVTEILEGRGQTHYSNNHYDPAIDAPAMPEHPDMGYITMLKTGGAGLKIKIGDVYVDAEIPTDHMLVNFGNAAQILVNDPEKLIAGLHYVEQVREDRVSFGVFEDAQLGATIVKTNKETGEIEDTGLSYMEYMKTTFKGYDKIAEEARQ